MDLYKQTSHTGLFGVSINIVPLQVSVGYTFARINLHNHGSWLKVFRSIFKPQLHQQFLLVPWGFFVLFLFVCLFVCLGFFFWHWKTANARQEATGQKNVSSIYYMIFHWINAINCHKLFWKCLPATVQQFGVAENLCFF